MRRGFEGEKGADCSFYGLLGGNWGQVETGETEFCKQNEGRWQLRVEEQGTTITVEVA